MEGKKQARKVKEIFVRVRDKEGIEGWIPLTEIVQIVIKLKG